MVVIPLLPGRRSGRRSQLSGRCRRFYLAQSFRVRPSSRRGVRAAPGGSAAISARSRDRRAEWPSGTRIARFARRASFDCSGAHMDALTLARWQFGITTVYHFFFVPLTLGLVWVVATLHTAWYVTGQEVWKRLTKFWGKLFLINFAMGVATGIVQEFQFGMNWSEYSRFVGDVFGAPLAIEALLAFFLESTFLGLWIFGWDKLPKKAHLAVDLARGDRLEHLRALDPHRELLHAAADGVRAAQRPGGDGELRGAGHEPPRLRAVPPRDHGGHGHRRLLRPRQSAPGTSSGRRTTRRGTPSRAPSASVRSTPSWPPSR